ncbi:MAG: hypothetical protein U1F56_22450 [Rubrivivax sp.]
MNPRIPYAIALLALAGAAPSLAQPRQEVKPPQAQAWIDVATFSGLGLPMGGAGANPMAALGALFGRGGGERKVSFGMTQGGGSGRYVDVTLHSNLQPALARATQEVPPTFLSPALELLAPREAPPAPAREADDEVVPAQEPERPKGRILLYWGCGETVRAGQPRVLDLASAGAADLAAVFQARRATQRGAHSAAGRPHWPNATDGRAVPDGASLAGPHQFSGAGVPEGFRFTVPPAQDLMPPLGLQQAERGGAVDLSWAAQPNARAFFVAGMGARSGDEMVMWTSSELPDSGFGLIDYQTNAAVDRWLREKVLLASSTTRCTIPKGVFSGEGAMLRAIAYGHELNLAHPPRPTDPRQPWEPVWAVKLRVKSVATAVLGMPAVDTPAREAEPADRKDKEKKPGALDILRGVLGR